MQKFSLLMVMLVIIFTACAAPVRADSNVISLQTPENGAIIDTLTPNFAWSSSTTASYYSIQVASDPNFRQIVIDSSNLPTSAYSVPPGRLNHATFYWRVNANAKGKTSGWSDISVFTISKAASGTIMVDATLNGATWVGNIDCSIVGSGTTSVCSSVPEQYETKPAGSYTLVYNGGGPAGASLSNITPSPTQNIADGNIINFTLNYVSNSAPVSTPAPMGSISIYATLNGSPLSTSMDVTLNGPYTETLYTVPTSRYNLPPGNYYVTYNYGAPAYTGLSSIYPSYSQFLPVGGSITYTMQFSSTGYYNGSSYPVNPNPPPVVVVPPPVRPPGGVPPVARPPIAQPPQMPPVQPKPPAPRPPAPSVQPLPAPRPPAPSVQPVQPMTRPAGGGGGGRGGGGRR